MEQSHYHCKFWFWLQQSDRIDFFSHFNGCNEGLWILNFTLWADILSTASCVISFSFSSPLVFFLRHILGVLYYIWDIMPAGCFLILHTEWHSFHFLHTYINTECKWKLQLAMFDELCSGLSYLSPLKSCDLFGTMYISYNSVKLLTWDFATVFTNFGIIFMITQMGCFSAILAYRGVKNNQ